MIIHVETEKITYNNREEPDVMRGVSGNYSLWLLYGRKKPNQAIYGIGRISDNMSIECRENNKHPADISRYKDKLKELLK